MSACVLVENKWANIDVIYYEYGALVLVYNNSERATRSFNILQDAMFDSKPLLVLLLPNIQVPVTVCSYYVKPFPEPLWPTGRRSSSSLGQRLLRVVCLFTPQLPLVPIQKGLSDLKASWVAT